MENEPLVYPECPIEDALSLTSLYTFFTRRYTKDYVFKGETHDFSEVVCVTDGKVGVTADKDVYVLSAGQMILHPPEEFHSIWSDCGTTPEAIIFSFRAERFPDLSRRIFRLTPDDLTTVRGLMKESEKYFDRVGMCLTKVKNGYKQQVSAFVKKIELFLLSVLTSEQEIPSKYTGRSAENYVRILSVLEGLLEESPSVSELALACNMSVPAMEKTVYRFAGCGVLSYFNGLKFQRAKEYLSSGLSVKETSLRLGFSNQNYFSSRFKKYTGVSPTEWKKN